MHRPTFIETVKDTWNGEIVGMVRWLQGLNMVRIRENAEGVIENVVEKVRR
jgi:altered-inheritance-of-mitochondria protein 5